MSYKAFLIAAALAALPAWHAPAEAQFNPFLQLPEDDFTWRWGQQRGGIEDFNIRATYMEFSCTLTGMLQPRSRLTRMDMRSLQMQLQSSMNFIEEAANTMNQLERRRDLQWAVLDCERQGDEE